MYYLFSFIECFVMNANVASIVVKYLSLMQLVPFFESYKIDRKSKFMFWMGGGVRIRGAKYVFGLFSNMVFARVHVMIWNESDVDKWSVLLKGRQILHLVVNGSVCGAGESMRRKIGIFVGGFSGITSLTLYRVGVQNLNFLEGCKRLKYVELDGCDGCYDFSGFVGTRVRMIKICGFSEEWEEFTCESLLDALEKCVELRKFCIWGRNVVTKCNLDKMKYCFPVGLRYLKVQLRTGEFIDLRKYEKLKVVVFSYKKSIYKCKQFRELGPTKYISPV